MGGGGLVGLHLGTDPGLGGIERLAGERRNGQPRRDRVEPRNAEPVEPGDVGHAGDTRCRPCTAQCSLGALGTDGADGGPAGQLGRGRQVPGGAGSDAMRPRAVDRSGSGPTRRPHGVQVAEQFRGVGPLRVGRVVKEELKQGASLLRRQRRHEEPEHTGIGAIRDGARRRSPLHAPRTPRRRGRRQRPRRTQLAHGDERIGERTPTLGVIGDGNFVVALGATRRVPPVDPPDADHPEGSELDRPEGAHAGRAVHGVAGAEGVEDLVGADGQGVEEGAVDDADHPGRRTGRDEPSQVPPCDGRLELCVTQPRAASRGSDGPRKTSGRVTSETSTR